MIADHGHQQDDPPDQRAGAAREGRLEDAADQVLEPGADPLEEAGLGLGELGSGQDLVGQLPDLVGGHWGRWRVGGPGQVEALQADPQVQVEQGGRRADDGRGHHLGEDRRRRRGRSSRDRARAAGRGTGAAGRGPGRGSRRPGRTGARSRGRTRSGDRPAGRPDPCRRRGPAPRRRWSARSPGRRPSPPASPTPMARRPDELEQVDEEPGHAEGEGSPPQGAQDVTEAGAGPGVPGHHHDGEAGGDEGLAQRGAHRAEDEPPSRCRPTRSSCPGGHRLLDAAGRGPRGRCG